MGKLIGGLLGLLAGGLFGLLIGVFLGHLVDLAGRFLRFGANVLGTREAFFNATFQLMGRMAKTDGRISEAEIEVTEQLMARLGLGGDSRQEAIRQFKRGAQADFDVDACLDAFMSHAGRHANLRQMLLLFLFSTAMADQEISTAEMALLRHVAGRLGLDTHDFERLLAMFRAQEGFAPGRPPRAEAPLADAYRALGVNESASDREVKTAYRRLMKQYHPDKLIAEGLPEEMVQVATERAQEIQAAYARIKEARGM
jgi:DnaJ like chaperone protein